MFTPCSSVSFVNFENVIAGQDGQLRIGAMLCSFFVVCIVFVIVFTIILTDVNECKTSNPCQETERCINVVGSYKCQKYRGLKCPKGYDFDGRSCRGINVYKRFCRNFRK